VRLNVGDQTSYINDERVYLREILPIWQQKSTKLIRSDDLLSSLSEAVVYTEKVLFITDTFIDAIQRDDTNMTINDLSLSSYAATLNTARVNLNMTLASLESAVSLLKSVEEKLAKSQLGGTGGQVSVANAQVKQALGSLRAAQANYNKTILRSPISGVVNSIDIQTGDFVSGFQTVAEIANNNALEITTFVGQSDRALMAVQQEVLIEGDIPGLVGTIAPAVNPATGKIEVKIQSTSPKLVNGETVTVTLGNQIDTDFVATLQVPLTAVKFTADAGSVFIIVDEKLVTQLVEIGSVRDTYIEILSGVTADMEIVVDVRGLSDGEKVTVISK
jgi:RND family efflux transporter MFP subunit